MVRILVIVHLGLDSRPIIIDHQLLTTSTRNKATTVKIRVNGLTLNLKREDATHRITDRTDRIMADTNRVMPAPDMSN